MASMETGTGIPRVESMFPILTSADIIYEVAKYLDHRHLIKLKTLNRYTRDIIGDDKFKLLRDKKRNTHYQNYLLDKIQENSDRILYIVICDHVGGEEMVVTEQRKRVREGELSETMNYIYDIMELLGDMVRRGHADAAERIGKGIEKGYTIRIKLVPEMSKTSTWQMLSMEFNYNVEPYSTLLRIKGVTYKSGEIVIDAEKYVKGKRKSEEHKRRWCVIQ